MLSSIPKGGAVRLPSSSSSSSSSSSRLARRSKRREARRTNPEKAWSIPSCETESASVVLFRGSASVPCTHSGDGGYYPLYWCAREARERSARTPYTVARQCGAVRRDPRAARARTPRTAAPRVSDRLSVRKKMLCRAQGSQCCWFVLKPNKYLVLTPCAPRWSRARAGSPPCPDRRSRCGLAGAERGPQITPSGRA